MKLGPDRMVSGTRHAVARRIGPPMECNRGSRQAIAKHLSVLADAGLVESVRAGREIRYRVLGARLSALAADWSPSVGGGIAVLLRSSASPKIPISQSELRQCRLQSAALICTS
jgi:DNA-binding transcriptional ArsR family regulator